MVSLFHICHNKTVELTHKEQNSWAWSTDWVVLAGFAHVSSDSWSQLWLGFTNLGWAVLCVSDFGWENGADSALLYLIIFSSTVQTELFLLVVSGFWETNCKMLKRFLGLCSELAQSYINHLLLDKTKSPA